MATIEYSLFRVKLVRPQQKNYLHDELTAEQVFLKAIEEKPSESLQSGQWHLGNLQGFERPLGYFAVGRTTKTTNTKFDEVSGNFIEEDFETSPYTHVIYNSAIGFLGIAENRRLTRSSSGIASRIRRLLQGTEIVRANDIDVIVSPISDPEGFLKAIDRAVNVLRFTAYFTGPNPTDADEYFQKPLSAYCKLANAEKGKTQIEGENLSKTIVSDVARSTAATGNKATARIRRYKNQPPTTISLDGDPIKRRYDDSTHDPKLVAQDLNKVYKGVRADA